VGLELEPFADAVAELLDFRFDKAEWSFEGVGGEVRQLREDISLDRTIERDALCVPVIYTTSLPLLHPAPVV
jgi:hypothetical protein